MIAPMKAVPQNSGIDPKAPTIRPGRREAPSAGSGRAEQEFAGDTRLKKAQAFKQQRQDDA